MIALTIPRGGEAVECNECTGGEAWGHRCGQCNGGGYVVTENIMEREWNEIKDAALDGLLEFGDAIVGVDSGLEIAADRLQALIAKVSDAKHDDEELKSDTIKGWRAMLENIRAAQTALTAGLK